MKIRTHIGWFFTLCVMLSFGLFVKAVYPEKGYSQEQRATLDRMFEDIDQSTDGMLRHISVADIQLDAETFMENVR